MLCKLRTFLRINLKFLVFHNCLCMLPDVISMLQINKCVLSSYCFVFTPLWNPYVSFDVQNVTCFYYSCHKSKKENYQSCIKVNDPSYNPDSSIHVDVSNNIRPFVSFLCRSDSFGFTCYLH